jgi:CubicO group peptidase (beta-lactamase class C family)
MTGSAVRATAAAVLLAIASAVAPPVALAGAADDYFPRRSWRRARPAEQGLDARATKRLVRRVRANKYRDLDSLLLVRNGYLVVEEYFNGWDPDRPHTLQSDTKSVTSLLAGIAADRGLLAPSDRVLSFFPEYRHVRNLDERKEAMTVRDLLTMRTGLDWAEYDYESSPLRLLNESREDWIKFVLDWPMREQPGTRFEYNSGGVIVLGGIIGKATGQRVDAFAAEHLFGPIGVGSASWARGYPDGLPHTGGGLSLASRDMARLGYLVLRGGRWGDRQVVSPAWLEESLGHAVRRPRTFGGYPTDYGYLWWLMPVDGVGADAGPEADVITASGAGGQWIFVVPRHDLVVVVTAHAEGYDAIRPLDILYSEILPAVR